MPSLAKRDLTKVADSPFKVYAGDEPRAGGYRAVIKQMHVVKSSGDNLMFNVVLEMLAKVGSEKAKYDGYPVFARVVITEAESNQQREKAMYLAITGSASVETKVEGQPEKFKAGDGQKAKVLSMNGINPVGKIVNVQMRLEPATEDYPSRLSCEMIFAARDEGDSEVASTPDIEDDEEGGEEDLYTEDDLTGLGLPALRKILVDEFEMEASEAKLLKTKAKLVEAILAAQDEALEDDEEDEDEEDEHGDEELEEGEEDDEEEEDEDDEEDPEAELRSELAELDRNALKARIKGTDPAFKFLKSQTDEMLVEWIVKNEPPF
jgi:hypothetical protein